MVPKILYCTVHALLGWGHFAGIRNLWDGGKKENMAVKKRKGEEKGRPQLVISITETPFEAPLYAEKGTLYHTKVVRGRRRGGGGKCSLGSFWL